MIKGPKQLQDEVVEAIQALKATRKSPMIFQSEAHWQRKFFHADYFHGWCKFRPEKLEPMASVLKSPIERFSIDFRRIQWKCMTSDRACLLFRHRKFCPSTEHARETSRRSGSIQVDRLFPLIYSDRVKSFSKSLCQRWRFFLQRVDHRLAPKPSYISFSRQSIAYRRPAPPSWLRPAGELLTRPH